MKGSSVPNAKSTVPAKQAVSKVVKVPVKGLQPKINKAGSGKTAPKLTNF